MYIYMRTFTSFSQKPPLKFIYEYEHELSATIQCVSVMFTYSKYNL